MRVKGILCFTGNHEYEQRLVSSKSVYCVLVERLLFQWASKYIQIQLSVLV